MKKADLSVFFSIPYAQNPFFSRPGPNLACDILIPKKDGLSADGLRDTTSLFCQHCRHESIIRQQICDTSTSSETIPPAPLTTSGDLLSAVDTGHGGATTQWPSALLTMINVQ